MYSKKQVIKIVSIACVLSLLVGGVISGVYFGIQNIRKMSVVERARNIVCENYVDALTEEQLENMDDAAIAAMVASIKDPYSYYFDTELFDEFEENNQEEYVGIGVNVFYDGEKNTMVVMSPTAGGPAEKAGILARDVILGADDVTLKSHGYDKLVDYLKGGEVGDVVKLHIKRSENSFSVDVVRDTITLNTISGKILAGDIAYVKISEFKHNSVEDFKAAIKDITQKNTKGLIIDLRNNPGGYADSVLRMTDLLLPKGVIAYLEDNKGKKEYFYSDSSELKIPMVVLVNEGTASAAELMAGSLQAYDKAEIVGMKTFGKAVAQMPFMLTEETAIYLTSARYYTPKGECIDKKGIEPDVKIDMPEENKKYLETLSDAEDIQLQVAIETIMKKIK